MENDGKHQRAAAAAAATTTSNRVRETDFLLQWGNRKRLRCLKVKEEEQQHHNQDVSEKEKEKSNNNGGVIRKKTTSRIDRRVVKTAEKDSSSSPSRLPPNPQNNNNKNSDRSRSSENLKHLQQSSSPEKEERYYTTRGSVGLDDNGKNLMEVGVEEKKAIVWPKLFISLSSKEKEEDFMAMKGCKLPQRPKKRAKFIQKTLLLVSPGAWLSDLCQERYEVREKKTSKKRPRGLKAMGSMESDSE
ncbi:hypothetical protein AQUCO_00900509v1 [Aquilegia coerulea]|uniref:DUF1639 domain-containing protein n=1 Tax=Aquilegia coerulea TaxID=218851 RepID=A0A2G5EE36_AQUCA|nr:hypothetical protein AQUCO_00900509v1 [Aquilegia coerulea]PIA53981.1 hypothetical protein AQUCO_00900509v1 [Aquilegia coerulea]